MKSKSQQPKSLSDNLSAITGGIKRLGSLYIDKARLKTSEKLTILLSTVAFTAVVVALFLILLVFVSIGIGHLLATSIAPHLAYLYVAGFYLLLLVLMVILRKPVFINPISRFISRLLVKVPDSDATEPVAAPNKPAEVNVDDIDYELLANKILETLNRNASEDQSDEADEKEGGLS